jgi:uncharacterized protein (TIGR02145 family)
VISVPLALGTIDNGANTKTYTIPYSAGTGSNNITFSSPTLGASTFSVTPATIDDASGSITVTLSATPSYSVPAENTTLFSIDVLNNGLNVGSIDVKSITGIPIDDGAGGTILFATHNLGAADTSLNPDFPVQGIHGNYYQWGRKAAVADAFTGAEQINGWDSSAAADNSWLDDSKTVNDPCPDGWRVPTMENWNAVRSNAGAATRIGDPWTTQGEFGNALQYENGGLKLTLPATGYRYSNDGRLGNRGVWVGLWGTGGTSTGDGGYMRSDANSITYRTADSNLFRYGFTIRCVLE